MKALLLTLSGFLVTSAAFAGGAFFATSLLAAKAAPPPTLDMQAQSAWTSEAVPVARPFNRDRQEARTGDEAMVEAHFAQEPAVVDEGMLTASISSESVPAGTAVALDEEHVAWCANRYRSYDPETNTYRSFSGAVRPCTSPYVNETLDSAGSEPVAVEHQQAQVAPDQAQSCAARYRSYRASDNTYQPWGGGRRQICR